MQSQRGLKRDSVHTKFVLGAHPIIEQFIETMRIREIISTYMASDKRMKLDDDKVLTLLIHNILTTHNPLYEMEDWIKPLDAEKLGLSPQEARCIHDDKIGRGLFRFYCSRHRDVFFRLAYQGVAHPREKQRPSPRLKATGLGTIRCTGSAVRKRPSRMKKPEGDGFIERLKS